MHKQASGRKSSRKSREPGSKDFHLTDPDNNIIEITGGYHMNETICQSCGMKMREEDYGKNATGA